LQKFYKRWIQAGFVFGMVAVLCGCRDNPEAVSVPYPQKLCIDAAEVIPRMFHPVNDLNDFRTQCSTLVAAAASGDSCAGDSLEAPFLLTCPWRFPCAERYLKGENHGYFQLRALDAFARVPDARMTPYVTTLMTDENDLVREYAAIAAGKNCGDSLVDTLLSQMVCREGNGYIRQTAEAMIRYRHEGALRHDVSRQPVTGYTPNPRFRAFFIQDDSLACLTRIETADITEREIPAAGRFIYPHQQYKLMHDEERCFRISFGIEMSPRSYHVGEDSGWELPGLAVHAITDGIVIRILYDQTWGNCVAIESRIGKKKFINHFYGHLDDVLFVKTGERICCGQLIGTTGAPFSRENGGYRPHLHLGIAKGRLRDTGTIGYYHRIDAWYNPVAFLYARVERE